MSWLPKLYLLATVKIPFIFSKKLIFGHDVYSAMGMLRLQWRLTDADTHSDDTKIADHSTECICISKRGCLTATSPAAEHVRAILNSTVHMRIQSPTINTRVQTQMHNNMKRKSSQNRAKFFIYLKKKKKNHTI